MTEEMLLAAVDLGSNSFRVEIGRVIDNRIVTQNYWKETIRLAAGFEANGALSEEVMSRAEACLLRFNERIGGLPASRVRAVGTQAFREATNASEFLARAERALGYPIDILSGHEEARLVFKGCVSSLPASDGRRLVVDIGGASTEFVLGKGQTAERFESFHVGCVNTSLRFFSDGVLSEERFKRAVVACSAEFEEVIRVFGRGQFDEAYGSAGTFGAVAELSLALWGTEEVTLEHLLAVKRQLLKFKHIADIDFPGLKPDRRDVIAGGLAVLIAVFTTLGIERMRVAPGALRVGLLHDLLGRVENRDTRESSVQALMSSTRVSTEQATLVATLTQALVQVIEPNISCEDLKLLTWAARLHEVGMMISTSRYHRHGEYIVSNADLAGFSSEEQALLASYVLAQRGGLNKLEDRLSNVRFMQRLLALRLAVIFAHARSNVCLPAISAKGVMPSLTLAIDAGWLDEHPLTDYLLSEEVEYWAKTKLRFKIERK